MSYQAKIKSALKDCILWLNGHAPIYYLAPNSSLRQLLQVEYLSQQKDNSALISLASSPDKLKGRKLKEYEVLASVLFSSGYDELAQECLNNALSIYPESEMINLLYSRLFAYQGRWEEAYEHANQAQLLHPSAPDIVSNYIYRSYEQHHPERSLADKKALLAVERFYDSPKVLWSAAKNCNSKPQLERLLERWAKVNSSDKVFLAGALPMAHAASRAECFEYAANILLEGCLRIVRTVDHGHAVSKSLLADKQGPSVLQDISAVFKQLDIPFFFTAGTALGIIREGKPLDHDEDIDVGVFEEHWHREKILQAFISHPRFIPSIQHPRNPKIGLIHRSGAKIDLFKYYQDSGYLWHNGVFVRWWNTPFDLQEVCLNGKSIKLPGPADSYLTENYGDWRTPDASFDAFVDAPNKEVIWSDYYGFHLIRQLYKAFRKGNRAEIKNKLLACKRDIAEFPLGRELLQEAGDYK